MMKPTFLRWVAIAALMAGGTFSVAANPPAAPPVSYGVEEDVFHPVRATHGMVASVDALATAWASTFSGRAVTRWMQRSPSAMRWR